MSYFIDEIRADVEDVVNRMKPWYRSRDVVYPVLVLFRVTPEGDTQFEGWARMAQPIISFSVVEVGRPRIGENRPSRVRADVAISIAIKDQVKSEWEGSHAHSTNVTLTWLL